MDTIVVIGNAKKLLLLIVIACIITSFTKKEIKWVAIGDSITYLNDHPNETGNRITKGFMTRVVEKLPNIHYINQGHNGWTSGGIANEIEKIGLENADVYTIFLGTNDWWAGRPLGTIDDYKNATGNSTIYGSYKIIINKIKSLNKEAKIILMTPLQRGDFVYINNMKNNAWGSYKEKKGQTLEDVADAIVAIAKYERCKVIDLYHKSGISVENVVKFKRLKDTATGAYKNYTYPTYINVPFDPANDEYPYPPDAINMTYDGLHPSDKGYEIIAKKLVRIMKKY